MVVYIVVFFCKQKTSYDMRISDWSSDVCSSDLFAAMCREGYEGIVSKRADAPYRGKRTKTWLKIKCTRRQEFVIVGWTESAAKGRGFRALLLAQHKDGALVYSGKVGTGFDRDPIEALRTRMERLARKKPA